MIRARRPKPNRVPSAHPAKRRCLRLAVLAGGALMSVAASAPAWAQSPLASTYATRDGRAPTTVLGCVATDGSFTAQPCGVTGYPLHVTIDGGLTGTAPVPTTAAGTASPQLLGVQGGGSGALPVAVIDNTVAQVVVQTQLAAAALGTPNDAAAASTGSVVAQLRRISNLLAAAPNSPVNADGGQQVHVMNPPATQPVTNTGSFAVQDSAVIAGVATVGANTAVRSAAWTDASFTATATASSTAALGSVASRAGLHVWNIGTSVACMNYTSAAVVSGTGCAPGSVPIPAGSAYLEDQPGNVSPEAISFVCVGPSCPLTIKVR